MSPFSRLNVLVVDDDDDFLELVSTYLRDKGLRVTARRNANEALASLRDGDYNLVLCDVRMPGMSGMSFLTAARAMYPSIAILLMTAYEDELPVSEALAAGADGYLTKPFSFDKLSLIFERAYWKALSREDWWERHAVAS